MHEAGVAERILEVVLRRADAAGAARVIVVELEVGDACGVSGEAIRFHWGEASRGTPAEAADLRLIPSDDPAAFRVVAIEVPDEPAVSGRAVDQARRA